MFWWGYIWIISVVNNKYYFYMRASICFKTCLPSSLIYNIYHLIPPSPSHSQQITFTKKAVWQFLIKTNIHLHFNPAILLLEFYHKRLKTYVHTRKCAWMMIVALFVITKTWELPLCSSVGEWINKLWFLHTVDVFP